jgi:hypothetical protein
MPVLETKGALSAQGYGLTTPVKKNYIEDVFSTWLYTGTGASQTITNNIALSTNGGIVWMKSRSASTDHAIYDTARGATFDIASNLTTAQTTQATGLTAFGTTGFTIGSLAKINTNAATYVSWTFQKQLKFFDIVTYTGTGANRTIAHNLGSVPGCIMVKRTNVAADWQVYHRSLANTQYLVLNNTTTVATGATRWNSTTPTSTVFSLGTDTTVNASGGTYVAYLFAHDAGGFGNAGTDNVISCGIVSAGVTDVTLGWEPQFVLIKPITTAFDWQIFDNVRGLTTIGGTSQTLYPNSTLSEQALGNAYNITATGMRIADLTPSTDRIYIAIRRGPMKTPTDGTSVFGLNARTGTGTNTTVTGGQTDDAVLIKNRGSAVESLFSSRLTGTGYLVTSSILDEVAAGTTILQANPWDVMDGVKVGTTSTITNASANTFINYLFRRAPGFFDVVCYTATGVARTINHNLGVAPELMIVKNRSSLRIWAVYSASLLNTEFLDLSTTAAKSNVNGSTYWNSTNPTASVFSVGTNAAVNDTLSSNYIAYLFATVAGVSKVGSYTGTAATLTVNCGFTASARFVLIKRTDAVGDWYVWDSARGIVPANDPYWLLNSAAAEVTTTDWVDTAASGFELSNSVGNLVNVIGGTYLFLAIA